MTDADQSHREHDAGRAQSPPLIGLTTYRDRTRSGVWDVQASFLPATYIDGVTRAGGVAVLLPPQPSSPAATSALLGALDGLVVCGGKDIDPARYGQERHPETDEPFPDRDEWEDALLRGALERDVPFLGICRGAQLLNVSLGGTLHQHLPDVVGDRRYQAGGGVFSTVPVSIAEDSRLHSLLGGERVSALVYHHQAIDVLAEGLRITASTPDGTVEAVEMPERTFAVGVQWHPEEDASDLRLFAGLVTAARAHRAGRSTSS